MQENQSQTFRLFLLMKDGIEHPVAEILRKIYSDDPSKARISARIKDLKSLGYEIKSRKISNSMWTYKMTTQNPVWNH
jgi:biotin operon repressor